MKELNLWLHVHPLKAMGFTALFTGLAVALAFRDDWLKWGCVLYGALTVLWAIVAWLDLKKMVTIILAALLIAPAIGQETPRREQQEGIVGIGVGIVVICGGGYCVYKLVKFCQKRFPKDPAPNTNDPPAELLLNIAGGGGTSSEKYGGSKNRGNIGSCLPGDMEFMGGDEPTPEPITFVIDCFVEPGPRLHQSVSFRKGDNTVQSWQEFRSEVEAQGLYLTGNADGSEYFSRDGVPCSPGEVPLSFGEDGTVIHQAGGFPRTVAISRSTNLVDWVSLMQTTVGEGTGFQVVDTSTHESMFFKVELVGR